MNIHPVLNNVVFQFTDQIINGRFVNSSSGGLIISSQDYKQSNSCRWVKVTHVGPDVVDITPGEFALVDEGMWTPGFYVGAEHYWVTTDEKLIAVSDSPHTVY